MMPENSEISGGTRYERMVHQCLGELCDHTNIRDVDNIPDEALRSIRDFQFWQSIRHPQNVSSVKYPDSFLECMIGMARHIKNVRRKCSELCSNSECAGASEEALEAQHELKRTSAEILGDFSFEVERLLTPPYGMALDPTPFFRNASLFGYILPRETRDCVFEPTYQELLEDHIVTTRKYRIKWAKRLLTFCFFLRVGLMIFECLQALVTDKAVAGLRRLVLEPLKRWWLRL